MLYKERNVLLSLRERHRAKIQPIPDAEEARYHKVKRSMAAIKHVLHERKNIAEQIQASENSPNLSNSNNQSNT